MGQYKNQAACEEGVELGYAYLAKKIADAQAQGLDPAVQSVPVPLATLAWIHRELLQNHPDYAKVRAIIQPFCVMAESGWLEPEDNPEAWKAVAL